MTSKEKALITTLHNQGLGYKKIASSTGLSIGQVRYYINSSKANCAKNKCTNCGKELTHTPHHKEKRFCSTQCRTSWWNKHPELLTPKNPKYTVCPTCGETFIASRKERKYCSRDCYLNAARKEYSNG